MVIAMDKRCTHCKKVKPISDFYMQYGISRNQCKTCISKKNAAHAKKMKSLKGHVEDKEADREYMRVYYKANKERFAEYRRKFIQKNPDYYRDYVQKRKGSNKKDSHRKMAAPRYE